MIEVAVYFTGIATAADSMNANAKAKRVSEMQLFQGDIQSAATGIAPEESLKFQTQSKR
jgi:hypothetical protein